MLFKLWNGKESINGVNAEDIKKSFGNSKLALFYNVENVIERIEEIDVLRSVYELSKEEYPTDEDVCNGYLSKLAEQEAIVVETTEQKLERVELEILGAITDLYEEIASLKEGK